MVIWAYVTVVSLTWVLVAMNVRWVLRQYAKDHVKSRLFSHLATLFILGSLIIIVTHKIVDRVMEAEQELKEQATVQTQLHKNVLQGN